MDSVLKKQAVVGVKITLSLKAKILFLEKVNQVIKEIMNIVRKGIIILFTSQKLNPAYDKCVDFCIPTVGYYGLPNNN